MKFDLIHPRTIILLAFLFLAGSANGQSVPGLQAPDKPKVKDDTPAAVKAVRGEVPFSRMYGHLKLDATKTKRLGPISPSERKSKKGSDSFLGAENLALDSGTGTPVAETPPGTAPAPTRRTTRTEDQSARCYKRGKDSKHLAFQQECLITARRNSF